MEAANNPPYYLDKYNTGGKYNKYEDYIDKGRGNNSPIDSDSGKAS